LAASNAEESFQRLLGEYDGQSEQLEPIMACLVYTRRLAAAIAGLALIGSREAEGEIEAFVAAATFALDDVADAIANEPAPAALPNDAIAGTSPVTSLTPTQSRIRRISRQLKLLHDAAERWVASDVVRQRRRAQ